MYEKLENQDEYYSYPLSSTALGIHKVSVPCGTYYLTLVANIVCEYVLLPCDVYSNDYFVATWNVTNELKTLAPNGKHIWD